MANNAPLPKNARSIASKTGNRNDGHIALYSLPTVYRGIHSRVVGKIGCDPSYVSRVARGERTSDAVARALEAEIRRVLALSSRQLNQLSLATAHRTLARQDSGT
jgi:hypothetical protein